MSKWLATCAALAVAALIVWPAVPAGAAEPRAGGVSKAGEIEVSAVRRYHRRHVRVTVRPAYRYGRRYNAYGPHPYDLYANSHPYFVPGAPVGAAGLRHDGMGTGAYGFGYQ